MDTENTRAPIVVGVDGSEQSKAALAWASRYARLTSVPLEALIAWRLPANYEWTPPLAETWDPESDARTVIEQEVTEVLGPDPELDISTRVVEGHPAQVLTEASKHAGLVVVGSRGRGQFAGMLLGSVSEFLTTHAHCPVLVIRDETVA